MQNRLLASDYITRASKRLVALKTLFNEKAWADVVREAQEIVELALKALLKSSGIDVPRIHDVSDILEAEIDSLPSGARSKVPQLSEASRTLRRDRELAFYGSEDLTPSDFYKEKDAKKALDMAKNVVAIVLENVTNEIKSNQRK